MKEEKKQYEKPEIIRQDNLGNVTKGGGSNPEIN